MTHTGISAVGLTLLAATACITSGQTTSGAAAGGKSAPPIAGPATPAPAGKLMTWDGDKKTSGKGWASCSKKGECEASVESDPSAGRQGAGLKFQATGSDWMGFGWNWYGWYPENAGDNITSYKNLSFWVRVEAKDAAAAPDPKSVMAWLSCSCKEKKEEERSTAQVRVADYTQNFADGRWHEVVIPLDDFFKDKGANFDKSTTWEFDMGTWSDSKRDFVIYVDDVGFDKRAVQR
jgi:hypothetical protein